MMMLLSAQTIRALIAHSLRSRALRSPSRKKLP
jgi:hypothetical protein